MKKNNNNLLKNKLECSVLNHETSLMFEPGPVWVDLTHPIPTEHYRSSLPTPPIIPERGKSNEKYKAMSFDSYHNFYAHRYEKIFGLTVKRPQSNLYIPLRTLFLIFRNYRAIYPKNKND